MTWAQRVAGHIGGESVVAAALFQRRGSSAMIGDEGGLPSGAASELEAPGFPTNTIFAVTDAGTLYAFHRDPDDGQIGRWPLEEVGARLEERESNWNFFEPVGTWELLLTFPDGRSGAFESANHRLGSRRPRHVGRTDRRGGRRRGLPRLAARVARGARPRLAIWARESSLSEEKRAQVGRAGGN
jgi:hypothetical protein